MHRLTRREFARLILGGLAVSVLSRCTPRVNLPATSSPGLVPPTPPGPSITGTPAASGQPAILRNENVPGFYVRYYRPFQAVDPAEWTLSVEGLVKHPQKLSLADVEALTRVSQTSRMKCVECWSAAAKWEGFHIRSLAERVEPLPDARWVHFYCADDYTESLALDELAPDRVIFAYRMNDQPLPDPYGAPLRLIVPPKYGYKGPKAITRLVFATDELIGYWPKRGYSPVGDIEPGMDHPLDLGGARPISGGEIQYPDGIESQ